MKRNEEAKEKERKCFCPYCEEEISVTTFPFCQPCGVTLRYCSSCQIAVPREAKTCPQCGGKIQGEKT